METSERRLGIRGLNTAATEEEHREHGESGWHEERGLVGREGGTQVLIGYDSFEEEEGGLKPPLHGKDGGRRMGAKVKRGKAKKSPEQTAKILGSEVIYQGPVFGLRRDEVLEPSGVRATREVITHPGSVVVLPVLGNGKIVMIRQYRHATREYLWELVAGRKEPEETPEEGAARELLEETGYRARKYKVFLDVFPTPGFLEERMWILLAEGLTAGEAQPEEDEKIEVRPFGVNELQQMMKKGELRDAKSIAGILYYLTFLR